jgi:hypothetical protein
MRAQILVYGLGFYEGPGSDREECCSARDDPALPSRGDGISTYYLTVLLGSECSIVFTVRFASLSTQITK